MELRLDRITIKDGRRTVDASKVKELADSMNQVGLLNPITINKGYELVAGAHRLKAAELLGWQEINCIIMDADELTCELAEIDENLMRNELHYIDRGQAFKRRDELLTDAGMRRKDGRYPNPEMISQLSTAEIAAQVGVTARTVQQEKQIATNILPEVQHAIKVADLPKTDALKIARLEPEEQIKVADRLNEGAKSYIDAKRIIKREEVHDTPQIEGKYRVIYADPPWCYGDKRDGNTTGAEDHYPSMTISELCEMPIVEITEDNAVLFLWVTSPLLEECFEVIKAWGFKYKSSFVWDKVRHNMGHYNSVRHELLLICTKGSCLPEYTKLYDSVVTEERTEHSKKPETFRNIIETLYPSAKKIELFARMAPEGWCVWGNQT